MKRRLTSSVIQIITLTDDTRDMLSVISVPRAIPEDELLEGSVPKRGDTVTIRIYTADELNDQL